MSELDKIRVLRARLQEIERKPARPCDQPIVEIGRLALEAELSELGQRLSRYDYWRAPRHARVSV